VWFSYSRIAPRAVEFFDWINGWVHLPVTTVRIEGYTSIVLKLVIAFGMVFQVPLILFVLGWLGVITSEMLRKYRRFAIVLAFVLGMVLTPPDPMSQILMAVPLCLMYELCVWGVWAKERLGIKL
jgi:sec-independent protein translocase protein TatC